MPLRRPQTVTQFAITAIFAESGYKPDVGPVFCPGPGCYIGPASIRRGTMHKLRLLTILGLAFGLLASASADTLDTSGISAGQDGSRPLRGSTQSQVEAKYGSPVSKKAAVGDPPISRWDYADFTVYFEYDRVIHAVLKR